MLRSARRFASTLLVVEQQGGQLLKSNANALSAAMKLGFPVTAIVAGSAKSVAEASKTISAFPGIKNVLMAQDDEFEHGLAEPMADLLASTGKDFTHIVTSHGGLGKNVFPRVGALLDVSPIPDVTDIKSADTFERPIYAGNAIATVKSNDKIKLLTVRPTCFDPSTTTGGSAPCQEYKVSTKSISKWVSDEIVKSDRPELGAARIVVSGGRALKSKENFDNLIFKLADKLGAAIGASRAACDAGYCSHDLQVGQTGKIVAPEVYIAVGVSGAIQHLAGMKDSKLICAINNDPEAPIFSVADAGLVADLFQAVPELTSKL